MVNPKISFVIPVYNAEKKVGKCIKSIQKQTYKNIEIVCVNDGSKDKSLQVLENFRQHDDRVVIIDQQNQGAFMARKNGVLKASGDYVMFADADDYYCDSSMCEQLISATTKSQANVIQFGNIKKQAFISSTKKFIKDGYIGKDELFDKYYEDFTGNPKGQVFSVSLWDKLYTADIIKKSLGDAYIKTRIGEDIYLNLSVLVNDDFNGVYVVNKPFYVYNVNIGVMSKVDYTLLDEYSEFKRYQVEVCDRLNVNEHGKYLCYLESIYFLKVSVDAMFSEGKKDEEIIDALQKSEKFDSIIRAKKYFKSLPKDKLFDELEVLLDANAEDYLAYIKANYQKPQSKFRKGLSLILSKFKR